MNWKNICASLIGVSMLTLAVPAFADDDPGPAAYAKAMTGKRVVLVPMAMGFDLASERLDLNLLEPYLGSIFSKMNGVAKSNLKLFSKGGNQYLTGDATVENGSLVIAYTQCKYLFNNETITFREDEIDLGTIKLKDTLNNDGSISGKMYHNFFNSFSFENIRFETSKMLV